MRKQGINVKLLAMDWAAVRARRSNKGDPMETAGNLFATDVSALLASNPATNLFINRAADKAWIGWPCDEKIEALRAAFVKAPDERLARRLRKISIAALTNTAFTPRWASTRSRRSIEMAARRPLVPNAYVYWNIEKA